MKYTIFVVSFFGMWVAYIIGTFYPDTRDCTGPLTILAIVLLIGSAVAIMRPQRST